MHPFINVLGKVIPMYGVMAFIGGGLLCLVSVFFAKKRNEVSGEDIFYMLLYAGIGCMIGSKLLYIIVSVDPYWFPQKTFLENIKYWADVLLYGGLVFYGGLAGAFLGALRYCRHFSVPFESAVETVIPGVPLFHSFGRVGCFMAGCCYGIEYDGAFAVTFENAIAAPNGVSLLPVQLIEAVLDMVLFAVLAFLYMKNIKGLSLSGTYLVSYSVIRFLLEFFRGDEIRGSAAGLSVSQWISIFVFIAGAALIIYKKYRNATVN